MERHYETVCIVKPDIGEEATKAVVSKASALIEKQEGTDVDVSEWGRRKLAYPIAKKTEGFYFVLTYTSPETASKELERTFRINEDVLRFQTVRLKERLAKVEEPVAAEEPKAEEPKAEEPKAEEPKAEEPKAEEPKAEEPKAEEPKAEEPKAEKAPEPEAEAKPAAEAPKAVEEKPAEEKKGGGTDE